MSLFNYLCDIINISNKDILLVSFPKSGNTRIRLALAKYIQLLNPSTNKKFDYEYLNFIMPELGLGRLSKTRQFYSGNTNIKDFPIFIKSHLSYNMIKTFISRNFCICILRDGPDTLMSYYDYSKARGLIKDLSFSSFLRNKKFGVLNYVNFVDGWLGKCDILISYKDLLINDEHVILSIFDVLNIEIDRSLMLEAIRLTRRERVVSIHNEKDGNNYNFAKYKERTFSNYFNDEDILYYNSVVSLSKKIPLIK